MTLSDAQRRLLGRGKLAPVAPISGQWDTFRTLQTRGLMEYADATLRTVVTTVRGEMALADPKFELPRSMRKWR